MAYSAILFDDGTSYTSEEVQWVIEDYYGRAERSVVQRRNYSKYAQKMRGTLTTDSGQIVPIEDTPKDIFLRKVKACNDYNWIIAVALVRNELDPMHSLRVKVMSSNRIGGSTLDIMTKHIDEVLRDTDSSYSDRARAKDYIKFIEDMGKKWKPDQIPAVPPLQPNINVGVAVNTAGDKTEAKAEIIDVTPVKGLKSR